MTQQDIIMQRRHELAAEIEEGREMYPRCGDLLDRIAAKAQALVEAVEGGDGEVEQA